MPVGLRGHGMDGPRGDPQLVTCPACGCEVDRREAREYHKDGDTRAQPGERLEYLCLPCDEGLTPEPRDGLEPLLVDIDAGRCDRETFLQRYVEAVEGRRGRHGDR